MNTKKRRYIQTKFIHFITEKNKLQDDDEVQDEIQEEEVESIDDEVQDEEEDLLTEIMRDLKKLERRK